MLAELIRHHVNEEEQRDGMFAKAKQSEMDLEFVGEQLQARKEELTDEKRRSGGWLRIYAVPFFYRDTTSRTRKSQCDDQLQFLFCAGRRYASPALVNAQTNPTANGDRDATAAGHCRGHRSE